MVEVAARGPVRASVLPMRTSGPDGAAATQVAAASPARRRARSGRIPPLTGLPLCDHAIEESLGWALAPLRDETVVSRDEIRAVLLVQPVGVGPVLVHPAPRVGPVVVDLAAQEMPADPPHVLVLAELLQMLVSGEHVVDVRHLERQVVQAGALVPDAEEDVMVDEGGAAVEPVERADDVVLAAGVHVVRANEAERLAEPPRRLDHLGGRHDAMADPFHPRGAPVNAHHRAGPLEAFRAEVEWLALHGDGLQLLDPVHDLDLVAVRLLEPHPLAPTRLVDVLDARRARRLCDLLEIVEALRVEREPDEPWIAILRDVEMVRGIGAAHVEGVVRPIRAHHSEIGQELFGGVEVGRAKSSPREIRSLDECHRHLLLFSRSPAMLDHRGLDGKKAAKAAQRPMYFSYEA